MGINDIAEETLCVGRTHMLRQSSEFTRCLALVWAYRELPNKEAFLGQVSDRSDECMRYSCEDRGSTTYHANQRMCKHS